jgi:hypothetical protein
MTPPGINRSLDVLWIIIVKLIQHSTSDLYCFLAANSIALGLFRTDGHGISVVYQHLEHLYDEKRKTSIFNCQFWHIKKMIGTWHSFADRYVHAEGCPCVLVPTEEYLRTQDESGEVWSRLGKTGAARLFRQRFFGV